jgi:hypothetical protein
MYGTTAYGSSAYGSEAPVNELSTGGGGTTPVQNDLQVVWPVLASVAQTKQIVWPVLAAVTPQTRQIIWPVLVNVVQTDQVLWPVLANVISTKQVLWPVQASLRSSISILWPVFAGRYTGPVKVCELGCGDTVAIITDAKGGRSFIDLTSNFSRLDYGRVMDDTSQSSVDVAIGGTDDGAVCCEKLGDTRTWRHALSVYRDSELVWGPGPIVNLLYGKEIVRVVARDISAWLDKRKTRIAYTFEGISAVEIARILIVDAMAPNDPAGLVDSMIIVTPAEPKVYDVTVDANIYVGDALRELAKTIIDFTVVGRSIIISEQLRYGPYARLTDEDFLSDIEVEERGLEAGTDWTAIGSATTDVGETGGIDPYFGLLEGILQDQDVTDADYLLTEAERALGVSNPPPVYINMPNDARLSPTAPVCFEQLVPGTLMDIDLRDVCRPVSQRNRLTALKVQLTGDDEQVGVTLSPAGPEFSTPAPPVASTAAHNVTASISVLWPVAVGVPSDDCGPIGTVVPFSDDYNRVDAGTLGASYSDQSNATIDSNRAHIGPGGVTGYALHDAGGAHATVSVKTYGLTNGGTGCGVLARWVDNNNKCRLLKAGPSSYQRLSGGSVVYQVNMPHDYVDGDVMGLKIEGTTVTCYLNGSVFSTFTDAGLCTLNNATKYGIFAGNSVFGDVHFDDLDIS